MLRRSLILIQITDSEATISQQELPPNLKSLTMFEDPESYFSLILGSALPWRDKLPEPSIGAVLAKSSLSLEQLSASFFMEANDFFTACRANWIWKDLHSLVLTSMLLNPNADASEVNGILYAAGMAAHHMPQLQTMEIWNGNFECACIFRYNVTWNCATLTLLRSWDLDLEARVIQPWEDVARTHGHDTLCVNVHSLSMSNIQSCTDIIDYLKLKQHVLHPVSLRQIQREARGSTSVFGHGFGLFM